MSQRTRTVQFGLGSMGLGMGISLLRAGLQAKGHDPNPKALEKFVAYGGQAVDVDPDDVASADIAVIVVLNAQQTENLLFGEHGIVGRMKKGAGIVACATVPPAFARDMASRCLEQGIHYLDAPISGGAAKAERGELTIMASGTRDAFAATKPAVDAMAERVFDLGVEAGKASAMKAVNQMLAGIHIAAMAEATTFAISQGITPQEMLEVIPKCAGSSWMLENRLPHIVDDDYSPRSAIDIWPKDLGIVSDIARGAKFGAPLTAAALQQFLAASGSGLGQEDDAAVAKVYARNANLNLPEKGKS